MSFHRKIDTRLETKIDLRNVEGIYLRPRVGAEWLVGVGFRCWLAGYDTGDIACWETGWNEYSKALGPERAKRAVTELACWVRALRSCAAREIEYYPFGCSGFCQDECMAVSLIAASQHQSCPAMRACAAALTGADSVDLVLDTASSFGDVLQEANMRLRPEAVAALSRQSRGTPRAGHA
jgi:hypothetical protein